MKSKLTHTLPQIRCSEETRMIFDSISKDTNRSISNILQIYTEKIAKDYLVDKNAFDFNSD